jgi:hypothetical protein
LAESETWPAAIQITYLFKFVDDPFRLMKNTLTIRLTEAAVFLRTDENNTRRRNPTNGPSQARPSMLRGLLTLNIGAYCKNIGDHG